MVGGTTLRRSFLSILIAMSLLMTLVLPSVALGGQGEWTSIGPAGADVMSIALSPNYAEDKTIFIGTANRGVCKSTDRGASWTPINSGIMTGNVRTVVLSPDYASDQTLFAGAWGAVYKSTDGGASWIPVLEGMGYSTPYYSVLGVYSIALSPNYAIDHTLFAGTWGAVYKSTNGGASWAQVHNHPDGFISIALSPNYAADETIFAASYGFSTGSICKSTDGGAHWTRLHRGHPCSSLAISPNYAADQTLYVANTWNFSSDDISKSTDGGASWTLINGPSDPYALPFFPYIADGMLFMGTFENGGVYRYSLDAKPPTTTFATNPPSPNGSNGWFKSATAITLTSNEPSATYYQWDTDAGPWNAYGGPISVPEGRHTLYCYSVDQAGNREATHSKALNVDLTAPSVTVPQDITLEATDPDGATADFAATATDSLSDPVITYSKNPGSTFPLGDTSVTVTATDEAGNSATKSFSVRVQDTTPPSLTAPSDITVEATGSGGAKVDFVATATDAVGPVNVTYSQNPGTVFSPGETTVTVTAMDGAGNSATKSFKVKVTFGWFGFLQPISVDPNKVSVVKAGSTLPVKFKLTDASAGITDGAFRLYVTDLDASGGTEEMAAVSTSQATTGNLFRYDATSDQYVFNLSTKDFVNGHAYCLRVDLGDGTFNTVRLLAK